MDKSKKDEKSAEQVMSTEAMMSYIVDYGCRVLTDNNQKARNILSVVYYDEKECLSSSGVGNDECTLINLNKIKNPENIKSIYNIIKKIVESLKVDASTSKT